MTRPPDPSRPYDPEEVRRKLELGAYKHAEPGLGATMAAHTSAFNRASATWLGAFKSPGSRMMIFGGPLMFVLLAALAIKWGLYTVGLALIFALWLLVMFGDVVTWPVARLIRR